MRYFFHIGYNGYNYHGWQKHPGYATVQETLESTISKLLKEPTTVIGCGRTDALVHARQYFFHLNTEKVLNDEFLFRINKILPEDIAVFDILKVDENEHAQHNAVQRTYDYFIHTSKDPFLNQFSCYYQGKELNTGKMKQAIDLLTKYNDFYAFCKSPEKQEHTICNLSSAKLFSSPNGDKLHLQVTSNRFVRGMIRAIVAKLLKTGNGAISVEEFENHLIAKESQSNIEFALPQGLYLSNVVYPFLDTPPRTDFSPFSQDQEKKAWQLL